MNPGSRFLIDVVRRDYARDRHDPFAAVSCNAAQISPDCGFATNFHIVTPAEQCVGGARDNPYDVSPLPEQRCKGSNARHGYAALSLQSSMTNRRFAWRSRECCKPHRSTTSWFFESGQTFLNSLRTVVP